MMRPQNPLHCIPLISGRLAPGTPAEGHLFSTSGLYQRPSSALHRVQVISVASSPCQDAEMLVNGSDSHMAQGPSDLRA